MDFNFVAFGRSRISPYLLAGASVRSYRGLDVTDAGSNYADAPGGLQLGRRLGGGLDIGITEGIGLSAEYALTDLLNHAPTYTKNNLTAQEDLFHVEAEDYLSTRPDKKTPPTAGTALNLGLRFRF